MHNCGLFECKQKTRNETKSSHCFKESFDCNLTFVLSLLITFRDSFLTSTSRILFHSYLLLLPIEKEQLCYLNSQIHHKIMQELGIKLLKLCLQIMKMNKFNDLEGNASIQNSFEVIITFSIMIFSFRQPMKHYHLFLSMPEKKYC